MANQQEEEREELPLTKAAEYLLEECRMVLPGIQALFGFQLVSVFSQRFAEELSRGEQQAHLVAIVLIVIAIALIMTPAAFHRESGEQAVTRTFLTVSTRLLVVSMFPLTVALCIDTYLIARVIVGGWIAPVLSATFFIMFMTLWFVLPRWRRLQKLLSR
ncbi:MAG TPA: DUF6328 family protein [Pyrinomonadaceae bacterium]|jgi:quinol-cytochrome oxidoreductase complex cytochrome b subunit